MQSRNRNRMKRAIGAQSIKYAPTGEELTLGYYDYLYSEKYTSDVIMKSRDKTTGHYPTSDFEVYEYVRNPGSMSGSSGPWRFSNIPMTPAGLTAPSDVEMAQMGNRSDVSFVNELLAKTNPFRPVFSVPVAIKELTEVTSLLKLALGGVMRFAGGNYLNLKFGYIQLCNDIITLSRITVDIERRIKEFNSLVKVGGLRRKVSLARGSTSPGSYDAVFFSAFATWIAGTVNYGHRLEVWGSCRWRPRLPETIPTDRLEQFNLAVRKVFDLENAYHVDGSLLPDSLQLWQMLPLSWLVDYFINLSDLFGAFEGYDLLEPYDICIMRKRTSWSTQVITDSPDGITSSGGNAAAIVKARKALSYDPLSIGPIQFTFMTEGQLTNLIALLASYRR